MQNTASKLEPEKDCAACPRLVGYRNENKARFPGWHNAPVPAFGPLDAPFLIVGLAPGLRGANWSGRPFTGDFAGDLLYGTLAKFGFSRGTYAGLPDDGVELVGTRITNAVRCVPPQNKVIAHEIKSCGVYLAREISALTNLRVILSLGTVAHRAILADFGVRKADFPFRHGGVHRLPDGIALFDSYHCSRYNTNTRRLTEEMFTSVFQDIHDYLQT